MMLAKIQDSGGARGWPITVILPLLLMCEVSSGRNCSFDASSERLSCAVEALTTETSSVASASHAREVEVTCDKTHEALLRPDHFGRLPDLRSLALSACTLRKIPARAFSGLSGLTDLSVTSEAAETTMELESEALSGLNSLRRLNLSGNNLWTLPAGALCSLRALQSLNLSSNYLQSTSELGFGSQQLNSCRLPLTGLDLSGNRLSRLPEAAFGQLHKLERLDLSWNNLHLLHDLALQGLHRLQRLNLQNNKLVALPAKLFHTQDGEDQKSCCKSLQELHLQNNSLTGLAPGLLDGLDRLLVLNLSNNDLSNEWIDPASAFSSLRRLLALDLSRNRLKSLDERLLAPLTSLQLLDLGHNQLVTLPGNSFLSQYNLHILRLSHNHLESLDSHALNGLSVLGSLDLDHNRLRTLDSEVMQNCTGLVDLTLSHNQLIAVPIEALTPLARLKTLDLGDNAITDLTADSLKGLQSVYALTLAGNGIVRVVPSAFDSVPSVRVLNLAHNAIKELDEGAFRALKKLRMLRLDSNVLEDINGILAGQTEVKWLNVSSNRLQWFDYAFIPKSLEWLDLSHNHIEDLGNYYKIEEGFSLVWLNAAHNHIKKLEELSLPASLREANLSGNRIRTIAPGTLKQKSNLAKVDLTENLIKQLALPALAVELSDAEAPLPEVLLGGNPFLCNCEMEWLLKINQMSHHRQYPFVSDLAQVQCRLLNRVNMSLLVTRDMASIRPNEFLCQYQAHCFALCNCCDFFACDCRMQCPHGCACFHDSTWSANIIQCSARGHSVIPPLIPMDATIIYMDGNNLTGKLESQAFIGRKRVRELFLNDSKIEAINNQTFNGLTELEVLHLENNLIRRLEGYELQNLTSLRNLFLQQNLLMFIHEATFASLVALQELHLEGNRLSSYPVWDLRFIAPLSSVHLSSNPWSCGCDYVRSFQDFATSGLVADFSSVECIDSDDVHIRLSSNITCSDAMAVTYVEEEGEDFEGVVTVAIASTALVIVLLCVAAVAFVFRTPVRIWLHAKYGLRMFNHSNGSEKLYDAFVCYASKDEDFVQQILLPQTEQQGAYKLCLQHRDLPSNVSFSDAFPGIAQLCSRHILVVSRAFVASEWPQVRLALTSKLRPLVVMLEELSSMELATVPELNPLLRSAPILRWGDSGFWNKLRFHLPDPRLRLRQHHKQQHDWHYDDLRQQQQQQLQQQQQQQQNSSTGGSTANGGLMSSPHTLSSSNNSGGSSSSNSDQHRNLVENPLAEWIAPSSPQQQLHQSRSSNQHHTYSTIDGEPIYHTLEPTSGSFEQYDTLGRLDVMLPNGRFVPATLVRTHVDGRVVPIVDVANTMPSQQQFGKAPASKRNRQFV